MRIGIDARFYGPSSTGLGRYTERLLRELERLDTTNEYVIFLRGETIDDYRPSSPRFSKVLAPWRWYTLAEQVFFPPLLRRHRLDLIHFPHFNVPLLAPRPFVVTIHDMTLHKFPTERASTLEPIFYRLKHAAYLQVIRAAVRRSSHLIAVTEHTKQDVVQTYRLPDSKVTVTYEACDPPIGQPDSDIHLGSKYGITEPYLLYVGTSYPHKNLERLVDACLALRKGGERVQLVLVGKNDYFSQRLQAYVAARSGRDPSAVVLTGFVSDQSLASLYRQAMLYVFPSLYEGFGLPGLEAMANGSPVVAAKASSLPEVYGDAAAYFDPHDQRSITDVIRGLLHDGSGREKLRQRGFDRVKKFSWRRMAEETLAVYTQFGGRR